MAAIRVLIVDDSPASQRMLTAIVSAQEHMEVVGVAPTASIGLQRIGLVPDIVLFDVEKPEMSCVETITRIHAAWPGLPILLCSSHTESGAALTLSGLAAGASDCVVKPSPSGMTTEEFRAELVTKLRALGQRDLEPPMIARAAARLSPWARTRVTAIVIGSSTGGPNALATIFEALPGDLPVPILIVQHMPPLFTRLLSERLSATSVMPVKECAHGDLVEPGRAYLAPGAFHMAVVRDGAACRLVLNQDPRESSRQRAVDVLFQAAAKVYGGGTLGVVLTGIGNDGTRGARDIVNAGGLVVTQDSLSCVAPGMPSSVACAGLSDGIVPLDAMAVEIVRRTSTLRSIRAVQEVARG
jgi:two-component system chemotaxis response regulator CheB